MKNEIFKKAIFEALTPEYENMIPNMEDHNFSSKFEKNMAKLVKSYDKPYFKMINTAGKRVACILIVLFTASFFTLMNVEAVKNSFIDFFIQHFNKFSIVRSVDNDIPETIEDIYVITYDLSDYHIDYEKYDDYSRNITYLNGDDVIDYFQYVKSDFDIHLNTENADIASETVNGHEAIYYCDNHNYHHLIWDNGDYIISLSTTISKDALIEIANSVQKAEK